MDKLEILIQLIKQEEDCGNNTQKKMGDLLYQLQYNTEAFLFLYNNLNEKDRPDWRHNEHFRSIFLNVIKHLNDEEFNKYFFQGLENLLSIEEIRRISLNRNKNEQLKQLVNSQDNPTKINEIMKFLLDYYDEDNEKFEKSIMKYKENLKKLNTIKSKKSYALITLSDLLSYEYKKNGFNAMLELSNKLQFNLIDKLKVMSLPYQLSIFDVNNNEKNILEMIEWLKTEPVQEQYNILNNLTPIYNPIHLMKNIEEQGISTQFFLEMIRSHLKKIVEEKKYVFYLGEPSKSNTPSKILKNIIENEHILSSLKWHSLPFPSLKEEEKVNEIMKMWMKLELNVELNNHKATAKHKI